MWDLAMQPSLTSIAADFSDILFLLIILFVAVVGLAASLVIREVVRYYRFKGIVSGPTPFLQKKERCGSRAR